MIVEKEVWGNIPLLHIHNDDMNEETPVVIFLHGFMSAKEHNLHYAYQLVKKRGACPITGCKIPW